MLGMLEHLTVVTYDLRIATWLEYNTMVVVIVVGEQVLRSYHCTCGKAARDALSRLNIDKLFLSSNGVSTAQGLSTTNLDMVEIKSMLMNISNNIILLCDSDKFGRRTITSFARLNEIDIPITDSGIASSFRDMVENEGVSVEVGVMEI